MKKKTVSIFLFITLCLTLCTSALAVESYSNFTPKTSYFNQFSDVHNSDWFSPYVRQGFEYGLIKGSSATKFSPDDNLTIAETITLAVRLHSIYANGAEPDSTVPAGGRWYDPYVEYALANNIISSAYSDYNVVALRSEVAVIFAGSLPDDSFSQICTVNDNAIPDVAMSAPYAADVYKLYRAGILTGSDSMGTFNPGASITRSEIAAICVRIAAPSQRSSASINKAGESHAVLTAQQISEKCAPAVFFIRTYLFNGEAGGSGSGFFISSDGLAITNHHIAANSSYLEITTQDGRIYHDVKIIDVDKENDLALLKVNGTGFSCLEMGDSSTLKQGQQVYAFGSPLGLENTMSQGIISNAGRLLDGVTYIQISVPIASGSSGGALINENGKVVAITSAGFINSTGDLNLAIPINQAKVLNQNSTDSLVDWRDVYYPGFSRALDFGDFSGVKLLTAQTTPLGYALEYDAFDFHDVFDMEDSDCYANTIYYYYRALLEKGFVQTETVNGFEGTFETDTEIVKISLDLTGNRTITVSAEHIPQFYKEFSKLPDFGWYTGIEAESDAIKIDGSLMYGYEWSDYYSYSDFETMLAYYFDLLQQQNFVYKYGEDTSYLFEGNGLSVVFVLDARSFWIDVKPI